MNIKEIATELTAVRAEYAAVTKQKNDLEARKKALESDLMDTLAEMGMESVKIDGTTYGITASTKPVVEDWDAFYTYVLETGNLSLLYKQATQSVIKEILEAGETVPGVVLREDAKIYCRS